MKKWPKTLKMIKKIKKNQVNNNRHMEVVLTFWVFLKSWVQWRVQCTSCRGAQTPRNHRSGQCWGAEAPWASRPPPWSVAALPWSACGPEARGTHQVIWHECEHLLPYKALESFSYILAGNSKTANTASLISVQQHCIAILFRAPKHH